MEFFSATAAGAVLEKVSERAVIEETMMLAETEKSALEAKSLADFELNKNTVEQLEQRLNEGKYRKLQELKEVSEQNPELLPAYANDKHVKGQLGEGLFEANLSRVGEVETQIRHQIEGAESGNIIDVRLKEADQNVKMVELTHANGQTFSEVNYDIIKGDSASFEVKNGGIAYLRQELLSGDLLQQIQAGKEISDHSFVVINEDTAKELLQHPLGADTIQKIHDAGGKLIVGLPSEAKQMALFLS